MSAEFEGVTVEGSFDEKFSSTVHQFASHIAKRAGYWGLVSPHSKW